MIGYTCAYTPLPLLPFPYRILPLTSSEDQSGRIVHDNMCPHIRRVLDRALAPDLPPLEGVVFVNSCDSMRRLADAWSHARPSDRTVLLDLPASTTVRAIGHYASEITRLRETLSSWTTEITDEEIVSSIETWNEIAELVSAFRKRLHRGTLPASRMQAIMNEVSTSPPREALMTLHTLIQEPEHKPMDRVPVLLTGNVLPDPEALELIESSGARIVDDDMCTGSRLLTRIEVSGDLALSISRSLLTRPPCARTISTPGALALQIRDRSITSGARGVILHTLKFCDPYLARIPAIREELQKKSIPLLVLEGDLTLRSIGQHRTRIEAFVEMIS